MSTATLSLFDDEFLKKLEYLNIISKRLFAGQLRAERRTRKRGTGLEFADYRAYVAGDDFRPLHSQALPPFKRLILELFVRKGKLPSFFFARSSHSIYSGHPSNLC